MYKKIDLSRLIIFDIETMKNCFVLCATDFKTQNKKHFVIYNSPSYEDTPLKLFTFLKSCIKNNYTFVGFNNLQFDAQVLQYYYEWCSEKQDPLHHFTNDYIIEQLYNKAQTLISTTDEKEKFAMLVKENDLFCPQIDLFLQLHYNRPAKATSLKWLEFTMQMPKIQEMPIRHDENILEEQIDEVVEYCWNDVDSTFEFFTRVKFETDVRLDLSKEYDLNLINASEPKMVREIFGKFLCEEMEISVSELKKLKTIRTKIPFKDIIFPYTQFQTPLFKNVLKTFNDFILDATPHSEEANSKFGHTFRFQDMDVDLGLGGIHACIKSGVYTHKEDEVIEDADGKSFYPFLAIQNDLRPEHLGKAYNKVYPMMYEKRLQYDKKDPRNYIFKIILNSAYGLSKEINGYLYDPKYTFSVTINGQLSLLMLAEALSIAVPDIMFLQMNTDGMTYKYNIKYTDIVRKVCKWWEKVTRIELEYAYYEKMVIMDVNNYLAIKEGYTTKLKENETPIHKLNKDYIKKKGLFEYDMAYHKNPSSVIIPKALEQYFTTNLTPEKFITNENNSIFDYCNGVKKKSNFELNLVKNYNFSELAIPQQKVCRFIVSKKTEDTGILYKDFLDGRKSPRTAVMANTQVLPLNYINPEHKEVKNYSVDYQYYIRETQKIIELIQPSQTTLF